MRTIESLETAFYEISSMITACKGLDTILDRIVQESIALLDAHRVTIFSRDNKNGTINVQFTRSSSPEHAEVSLFEEKEVARRALEQNKSFLLKEPKGFSEFFKYGAGDQKITSLVCTPLGLQGKMIRVLSAVLINKPTVFDQKNLVLLSALGNHASIAMENTYLLAEVRKGVNFRRNYEQYLDEIQKQLQDLSIIDNRNIEHNIQQFLPEKKEGKSTDNEIYSHALSKTFDIPLISLKSFTLSSSLQKSLGEKYAANHKIVVLENSAERIKLALAEPTRYIMDELKRIIPSKKKIEFYLASPDEVNLFFKKTYNPFSLNSFK